MLRRGLYVKIEKIYHDFSLAHVQEGGSKCHSDIDPSKKK